MTAQFSRRDILLAMGAGAAVLGFDVSTRSWITEAHAGRGPRNPHLRNPPKFDGELVVDAAALAAAADDFGHIVSRVPLAVLRPATAEDIKRAVKYARKLGVKIAARGQGHSTMGHSQVEGGIVIDMSYLGAIHSITATQADVDAGVLWSTLIRESQAFGSTPPVTTDYIDLSIGGTLSIGGIGAQSPAQGFQVDSVLELQVVTGKGQLHWCSPQRHPELFYSALGTLGQFAIITRARLRMVPVKSNARFFVLPYERLEDMLADQVSLIQEGRFDGLQGGLSAKPGGGWSFFIEGTKFFDAGEPPNDAALLAGLRFERGGETITDMPYFDWANRLAPLLDMLKAIGAWDFPHPWLDVFVPASKIEEFMRPVVATLTEDLTGQGPVLLRPFLRSKVRAPYLSLPNEEVVFLFDILRFAPPVPAVVDMMMAHNRELYEQARALGGNIYPMCAVPHSQNDWRTHYGRIYPRLQLAKKSYDPNGILTPGPGIFG